MRTGAQNGILEVRAGKMRNIMVRAYLLTQTDPWACVEGNENERVGCEILPNPGVNEAVGIKLES